ncbi:MAG: hypothetical protein R2723_04900 [Microbacterium sp.]
MTMSNASPHEWLATAAPVPQKGRQAARGRTGGHARTSERETRTPIRGVRKATAAAMVRSAFTRRT